MSNTPQSVCGVLAAVHLRGGPHDGAMTPPVFPLESAPVTIDLPSARTDDGHTYGRETRYRWRGSWHGENCVILVYAFDRYVTEDCDGVG